MYKIIRHDGKKHRATIECNGVPCHAQLDDCGFPVYEIASDKVVARLVTVNPEKYRLYKSPAVHTRQPTASGALEWITVRPWKYKPVTKQIGVDETNGEALYGTFYEWEYDFADYKSQPASGVSVKNEAAPSPKYAEALAAVIGEVKALKEFNSQLVETVQSLTEQVKSLTDIAVSAKAAAPAVDMQDDPLGDDDAKVGKSKPKAK